MVFVSSSCVFVEQREAEESRRDLRGKNSASRPVLADPRLRDPAGLNGPGWVSCGRTRLTEIHTSVLLIGRCLRSSDPPPLLFLFPSSSLRWTASNIRRRCRPDFIFHQKRWKRFQTRQPHKNWDGGLLKAVWWRIKSVLFTCDGAVYLRLRHVHV